ncbi:hypothetical protein Nepgr_018829 [Nepenthes gracilis]|uniref:Uncharacterized protein n=1 Tax=Nepenthes gracilis TaxID=150966 RepID=A0AAD3SSV6_NEPGR|nr:hypothetical protein Nepgr_018829 [Nepenthes gracilis]
MLWELPLIEVNELLVYYLNSEAAAGTAAIFFLGALWMLVPYLLRSEARCGAFFFSFLPVGICRDAVYLGSLLCCLPWVRDGLSSWLLQLVAGLVQDALLFARALLHFCDACWGS